MACAGCGGGEEPEPRTVRVAAGAPVRITASEYAFDPGRVVVAGASTKLRITLDNRGDLAHNILVFDRETELGGLSSFPGGEQRSTTLALAPGSYPFVCTVADHEELGMEGVLEIRR